MSSGRRAFTLIEVMAAVTAFAIILAAIHSVFFGALRLRNKTTEALNRAVPLQQTLAIIKKDLANLVIPGGTISGVLQSSQSGSSMSGQSSPEFYTSTGIVQETAPWGEVQKVSYLLLPSTNQTAGLDLVRSVTRNLLPTVQDLPVGQRLMSGVLSLAFQYYDGTQWRESWDSTTEEKPLPQAIKMILQRAAAGDEVLAQAPIELVVPVSVQPGTNQTSQAAEGGA